MAELCGERHPERPEVACEKTMPCYGYHASGKYKLTWEGRELPETKDQRSAVLDVVRRVRRGGRVGPPVVRRSDPPTAHEAAERYEPKRETAKGRVLAYLRAHLGEWVDAPDLTAPDVGGFAGTRRLRELRDEGHVIETRPKPGEQNLWQHRLVE